MTKIELMRQNKANYAWLLAKAETLTGIEKDVAISLTARWVKGRNWEGGLGNGKDIYRIYEGLMELGYTFDEIEEVFGNQMEWFDGKMA